MSKRESTLQTRLYILSLAAIVGVITQKQLREQKVVSRSNLAGHLDYLLGQGHLTELAARRYYPSAPGRPSSVYQLTEEGATLLRDNWQVKARPSGLKNKEAINHALAMLDCRLKLNPSEALVQDVTTDKPIDYGESVIRPDNVYLTPDSGKPILVESEYLPSANENQKRIAKKVENLTRFYLSAVGRDYDNVVRIVYLWPEGKHNRALATWAQACREECQRRSLPSLPFRLAFTPHWLFLDSAEPLALDNYEILSLDGNALASPATSALPQADQATIPSAGTDEPPADLPDEPEDGPALDEATHVLLCEVLTRYAAGFSRDSELQGLFRRIDAYLAERPRLVENLAWELRSLWRASTYQALSRALEDTAMALFDGLRIPALLDEGGSKLDATPISVSVVSDGRTRPSLGVRVNPTHSGALMMGWAEQSEALGHAFEVLLRLLINHGARLATIRAITEPKDGQP